MEPIRKRCAIYTRKSIEEGLDMDFNTLDAQREAGESFVKSRKANGWICIPTHYDDAGFSGSNLDRPALKRLLDDAEAGLIDVIVVYKIDRLSRSIADFADLLRKLDQWGVSYVSVTQDINTESSSGRMMQNLLMTFAQFEREVIAERVRDKMAASKKRGLWMGGYVPYGFQVRTKKLYADPVESPVVKRIFTRFVEIQSPKIIASELNRDGFRTRSGKLWDNGYISRILGNHTYVGEVLFKGEVTHGEHNGIVSREIWDRTREIVRANQPYELDHGRVEITAPLKGILRCGHCGCAMMPSYSCKGKKRYYYYLCGKDVRRAKSLCPVKRIGSMCIETAVREQVGKLFATPLFLEKVALNTGATVGELQGIFNDGFWSEATSPELNRLYSELFEKIVIKENQLEFEFKTSGIKSLMEGVLQ